MPCERGKEKRAWRTGLRECERKLRHVLSESVVHTRVCVGVREQHVQYLEGGLALLLGVHVAHHHVEGRVAEVVALK